MEDASDEEGLFVDDDDQLLSLPTSAVDDRNNIQWDDDTPINNVEDSSQYVVIPVKRIPPSPTPPDSQLWMLGLPATVLVEKKPFNPVESHKEEVEISKKGDATAQRQLKTSLSTYYIRSYKDESGEIFEAGPREEQGLQTLLLEISETPVCHIHGKVTSKKLFSAPNMAEMRALMMDPKEGDNTMKGATAASGVLKTKLTTVQHGAESELRLKRHLEEQMAKDSDSRLTKSAKKKKSAMLNADFLEADD